MLTVAYSLFWVNFVYGVMVKANIFRHEKLRFLHHAIYFCVMLSLFISIVCELCDKKLVNALVLTFLFFLLLGMTRFSGYKPSHWQYAIFCNVIYTLIFIYLSFDYGTF